MSSISEIYTNGTYASKNPTFGDDDAKWKIGNALKACEKWKLTPKTIAEVGCGGGSILCGVAQALGAEKAVGYEPMPEAYAIAKTRETDNIFFQNETIDARIQDFYDLVLCFDVFEHIENYFDFLRNLRKMGRDFLFHIPLDMNAQMLLRGKPIMRVREQVGHIHYFSKDSALASLKECGYSIRDCFYTFGGDGSYSGLIYNIMKYPRKIAFFLNEDAAVRILGGYSLMVWAASDH